VGDRHLKFHESWDNLTERPAEAGIDPSVGSVGDAYDNALAETVIGLFIQFGGSDRRRDPG
jgi:hypothetical protein